jgi:hypothetical protein
MTERATWSIELDVREDAERMFVPVGLLPDAVVGDTVDVTSGAPRAVRRGRVVDEIDDARRGSFVTVSFE